MPKTTFILVTVLFGVICCNRLMDNRLLRSAPTSYEVSYKTIGDNNVNSYDGQWNDDLEFKNRDKPIYLPCGSSIEFQRDFTARNCNENLLINLLKQSTNYGAYDISDDKINKVDGLKPYQIIGDFENDDIFNVAHSESEINTKSMQLIQPKLNMFPVANYKDFYQDLVVETTKQEMTKRNGNSLSLALGSPPPRCCDCKIRNDLVDLGQQHFPRYLLNAICHSEHSRTDLGSKCWSGSVCRPLEYKVKVLTYRTLMDNMQKDSTLAWLPDDLRQIWKFKTVTVTAGCFCS